MNHILTELGSTKFLVPIFPVWHILVAEHFHHIIFTLRSHTSVKTGILKGLFVQQMTCWELIVKWDKSDHRKPQTFSSARRRLKFCQVALSVEMFLLSQRLSGSCWSRSAHGCCGLAQVRGTQQMSWSPAELRDFSSVSRTHTPAGLCQGRDKHDLLSNIDAVKCLHATWQVHIHNLRPALLFYTFLNESGGHGFCRYKSITGSTCDSVALLTADTAMLERWCWPDTNIRCQLWRCLYKNSLLEDELFICFSFKNCYLIKVESQKINSYWGCMNNWWTCPPLNIR